MTEKLSLRKNPQNRQPAGTESSRSSFAAEAGTGSAGSRNSLAAGAERKAADFIIRTDMIREGDRIIAGVSGGADSVCLLLILCSLQKRSLLPSFRLRVLHVHHGLREKAEADMQYVRELCIGLGVDCKCVRVDAASYAEAHRCGIEEAARILRYDAFENACRAWENEDGSGALCRAAVAHHLEDQAETVLFHLIRGSRIAGLSGMRPVTGRVIRPLLEFTREEIETYLNLRGTAWREDETNTDTRYSRNLLRREVVPLLTRINSGAQRHITQLADEAAETEDFLRRQTQKAVGRCAPAVLSCLQGDGSLKQINTEVIEVSVPALLSEEPLLQRRVLYTLIAAAAGRRKDLQDVHVRAVLELCKSGGSGRLSLPGNVCAVHEYDRLRLMRSSGEKGDCRAEYLCADRAAEQKQTFGGKGLRRSTESAKYPTSAEEYICRVLPFDGDMTRVPQNKYTKWLNYDKIASLPVFRTRLPGDRISLREDGTENKKLSRCMVDAKIPASVRDFLVFPAKGREILWVPGWRIHACYKVTPRTRRVLEICWLPGSGDEGKYNKYQKGEADNVGSNQRADQ